jgi:hypothetical protein
MGTAGDHTAQNQAGTPETRRVRLFYGPGDWLGTRFTARQRRAIGAWCMVFVIMTIPLRYPFRAYVSMVWAISEVALVFGLWAIVSAETPVESE